MSERLNIIMSPCSTLYDVGVLFLLDQIHVSLIDIMLVFSVFSKRILGFWIRSVRNEWIIASHSSVKWWEIVGYKAVNFLIHASLSNIFLVMLVMMAMMMTILILSKRWVLSRWIRTIWNKWICASNSGVKWWKSIPYKSVNFLIHTSFSDIFLVMLMVVLTLSKRSIVCRWVRAIGDEWFSASNSSVEWWESVPDKSMNFLIHSSLSNILLVVFMMMAVFTLGTVSIISIVGTQTDPGFKAIAYGVAKEGGGAFIATQDASKVPVLVSRSPRPSPLRSPSAGRRYWVLRDHVEICSPEKSARHSSRSTTVSKPKSS